MMHEDSQRKQLEEIRKHLRAALDDLNKARDATQNYPTGYGRFRHKDTSKVDAHVSATIPRVREALKEVEKELEGQDDRL